MPAATIAILQATRLPLHLGSGRFKNDEPGASRTCHFAGRQQGCPEHTLYDSELVIARRAAGLRAVPRSLFSPKMYREATDQSCCQDQQF